MFVASVLALLSQDLQQALTAIDDVMCGDFTSVNVDNTGLVR